MLRVNFLLALTSSICEANALNLKTFSFFHGNGSNLVETDQILGLFVWSVKRKFIEFGENCCFVAN